MSSGVGLCTELTEITYRVNCRVRGAGSSRARSTSASGRVMDRSVGLFWCQFYHARTGHTSFPEQNVSTWCACDPQLCSKVELCRLCLVLLCQAALFHSSDVILKITESHLRENTVPWRNVHLTVSRRDISNTQWGATVLSFAERGIRFLGIAPADAKECAFSNKSRVLRGACHLSKNNNRFSWLRRKLFRIGKNRNIRNLLEDYFFELNNVFRNGTHLTTSHATTTAQATAHGTSWRSDAHRPASAQKA